MNPIRVRVNGYDVTDKMPLTRAELERQRMAARPIRPTAGEFYRTRGGLNAYIEESTDFYGVPHWRGKLLDPVPLTMLWYENGAYSPVANVSHELDIIERL